MTATWEKFGSPDAVAGGVVAGAAELAGLARWLGDVAGEGLIDGDDGGLGGGAEVGDALAGGVGPWLWLVAAG